MRLNRRPTALLLDAASRAGIDVAEVLEPLGLDPAEATKPTATIDWSTFIAILDRISQRVDHDARRLQELGSLITFADNAAPLRRIARAMLSVERFYDLSIRIIANASFPHMRLFATHVAEGRLAMHAHIPEPFAPSEPFFHVSAGFFAHLPRMLGLPPATVLEIGVTPRTLDLVVVLPPHRSRIRAGLRSLLATVPRWRRVEIEALEEERRLLLEGLETIQRAHQEHRALFESLPDMVAIHVGGTIVYANRAFVRTLGWDRPDELVGRPLVDFVDPRSRDEVMERVTRPDLSRSPELTQAWFSTRSNTPIRVEIAPTQAVVFGGSLGWLIVGRDIEERLRLQERLATADRLAALGLLAAGVAHEVNNPLAYVLNNIEMARSQIALLGPSADTAVEALNVALEGVDRIRFIVRELLSLSRGEAGGLGPTDVRDVIDSTLSLARVEVARKAKVVVELGKAPLAHASAPRISQIFVNLVLNALEAMESSDASTNVLTVRLGETETGRVLIEVSDTGTGIPEHELPRIFEPFYTTKTTGKGTGLGLAITQRLVHELDGEITVASSPGRGSTFRVTLPAASDDEPRSGACSRSEARSA